MNAVARVVNAYVENNTAVGITMLAALAFGTLAPFAIRLFGSRRN